MKTVTATQDELRKAIEVLQKGRDYISDPAKWIQGTFIRDDAVCSLGAIQKVTKGTVSRWEVASIRCPLAVKMLACVVRQKYADRPCVDDEHMIAEANDAQSHEAVLAIWDAAIERAKRMADPPKLPLLDSASWTGGE